MTESKEEFEDQTKVTYFLRQVLKSTISLKLRIFYYNNSFIFTYFFNSFVKMKLTCCACYVYIAASCSSSSNNSLLTNLHAPFECYRKKETWMCEYYTNCITDIFDIVCS